jgi:hypothetical protein
MSTISQQELNEIVELANSVPEEYRRACFELLLTHTLQTKQGILTKKPVDSPKADLPAITATSRPYVLPIDVKAFLSQYGLDESVIWKFFIKDGEEIRPIYQLQVTKRATAQIQHALMLALESATVGGQFQVEIETLRNRCIDEKCYETSNFTKNIQRNAKLFKSIANDQPLALSPDGKSELAELLEQLKG